MLLTCHWSIWLLQLHEWMLALKGTLKWLKLYISLGICLAWISYVSHPNKSLVHKTYGCEITFQERTYSITPRFWQHLNGEMQKGLTFKAGQKEKQNSPGMSQSCCQGPLHCWGFYREGCEQAVWDGCRDHSVLRGVFPQETRDTC